MNNPLIKIPIDGKGIFIERRNRFLGIVDLKIPEKEDGIYTHIHDSGRLPDLLYPRNWVIVERKNGAKRKTKWDIVAAKDRNFWILTNSGYHSKIAKTLIEKGYIPEIKNIENIQSEPKIGNNRLDFLVKTRKKEFWIEVKGCTLKKGKVALFPDAPTKRGQKHINTLIKIKEEGKNPILILLVLRPDALCFSPNKKIDPVFYELFEKALKQGIKIYPVLLLLKDGYIYHNKILPICI